MFAVQIMHPIAAIGIASDFVYQLGRCALNGELGAPVVVPVETAIDPAEQIEIAANIFVESARNPDGAEIDAEDSTVD